MAKKKPDPSDLAAVLRTEIESSENSRYVIAQESGVDAGALSRFVAGERDLRLETATKLCRTLGLTLRKDNE